MEVNEALTLLGYNDQPESPKYIDPKTRGVLENNSFLSLVLKQESPLFLFNVLVASSLNDLRIIANIPESNSLRLTREITQWEIHLRKGAVLVKMASLIEEHNYEFKKDFKRIVKVLLKRCRNRVAAGTLLSEISRDHDESFRFQVKNDLMKRKLNKLQKPDGKVLVSNKYAADSYNPQGIYSLSRNGASRYSKYKDRLFSSWPFCLSEWLAIYDPLIDLALSSDRGEWEAYKNLK